MKIFISAIFKKDGSNKELIDRVKNVIIKAGHTPYSFADEGYIPDEKEMMQRAIAEMNTSDMVAIDITECAFGVGIEAGYMYAKNIPLIVLKSDKAKDSPTMKGIATNYIVYNNLDDLEINLLKVIK